MLLLISPFILVSICLTYCGAPILGAYIFIIVISLKEINPEYSLEGLMVKLKLQYFGHLIRRANSLEKTLTLGETEGKRRKRSENEMAGWHHRLDAHEFG